MTTDIDQLVETVLEACEFTQYSYKTIKTTRYSDALEALVSRLKKAEAALREIAQHGPECECEEEL